MLGEIVIAIKCLINTIKKFVLSWQTQTN